MTKKVNPHRKPATQADVVKARREAQVEAVKIAWAIIFTVLRDKEGYGIKRLKRVWDGVNELSDSISAGYVDVDDLVDVLGKEAGIGIR